jgi:hypothetical protein
VRVEGEGGLLVLRRHNLLDSSWSGLVLFELGAWTIRRTYEFRWHEVLKWCDGSDGHWRGTARGQRVSIEFVCPGCSDVRRVPRVEAIDAAAHRVATALALDDSQAHDCARKCGHRRSREHGAVAQRFYAIGDEDAALRAVDRALTYWPENREAKALRERLTD